VEIGFLTAPFGDRSLEQIVAFARDHDFQALEVAAGPGSKHLDTEALTPKRADEVKSLLADSGIRISSLAWYVNLLDPDAGKRAQLVRAMEGVIEAAAMLGVGVVCAMAGMPMPGKDRMRTIEEDFPGVFGPLVKKAGQKGAKIAFENWTATNFQNLAHWERAFELVPDANLGLNFDPSHLVWQSIDYLEAVERFRDRIFHTHAKDAEIKQHVLRWVGNQSPGWWRYCIPGYGEINWGVYIARLRGVGYDGVLSIEHEDGAFGVEEGFIKGQRHLARYA
jgi:sugar phosphate isomerase/epimerase